MNITCIICIICSSCQWQIYFYQFLHEYSVFNALFCSPLTLYNITFLLLTHIHTYATVHSWDLNGVASRYKDFVLCIFLAVRCFVRVFHLLLCAWLGIHPNPNLAHTNLVAQLVR